MRKHISAADRTPVRVVIVTMDTHLASATERARALLQRDMPGLTIALHAATEWCGDEDKLDACRRDIAAGDIVICSMLFMEAQYEGVLADLKARQPHCDAMVSMMSDADVMKLTRIGRFRMDSPQGGALAFLKRLKGGGKERTATAGARQMKMLKRLPQILRFIPGTAQDVRAYFLTLQYWLAGSEDNIANMVRALVDRYADGERRGLRGTLKVALPVAYPEVGVYHPRMKGRIADRADALPVGGINGTVGVLGMRSYMLAGNAGHYDGVIAAFEARGLRVVPAFASGLDSRPAIEKFFMKDGRPTIDALVSLTGFSLVGGPAYNDAKGAEEMLARLDVPYVAAHPAELQTLEQWGASERGLMPVESTLMVAIPELDGATGPMVFGGRSDHAGQPCTGCARGCTFHPGDDARDMHACVERADMLAERVSRLVRLRRTERAKRRVAIVLFNFPPNAGNTGTAAYLSVFASLHGTLTAMKRDGYGRGGTASQQTVLLGNVLAGVDLAYQNLDSVELGVTTVDHYFDTLGGISRAVRRARGGKAAPVYIGDQTRGEGTVRTLSEQVAIETRTRMLNPKWYEGMLAHGYEGVRQIEEHVRNTMGWSATTGEVQPWVYQQLTQTFVLDPEMRARLAALNPTASSKMANRLIEAHERHYWTPDPDMLEALRAASEELEDRVEGVGVEAAA